MNHIAAALLLSLGGKTVDAKGIEDVVNSAGGKVNKTVVDNIVAALKGKSCDQIIREGLPKLVSSSGVSAQAATTEPVADKKEEKKEEKKDDKKGGKDDKKGGKDDKKGGEKKKEEKKVEDEDEGFMGLF